eukprot:3583153-Rhodomonas_salina.4
MSGSELAYGANRCNEHTRASWAGNLVRWPMSGTGIADGAVCLRALRFPALIRRTCPRVCGAMSGTDVVYLPTCHAMSGTDVAHRAARV